MLYCAWIQRGRGGGVSARKRRVVVSISPRDRHASSIKGANAKAELNQRPTGTWNHGIISRGILP